MTTPVKPAPSPDALVTNLLEIIESAKKYSDIIKRLEAVEEKCAFLSSAVKAENQHLLNLHEHLARHYEADTSITRRIESVIGLMNDIHDKLGKLTVSEGDDEPSSTS